MSERTPAHRLEAQGIETAAAIHWNLDRPAGRARGRARRGRAGQGRPAGGRDRQAHRPLAPRTSSSSATPRPRTPCGGASQRADEPGALRRAQGRFPRRTGGKDTLFVADLFGGSQPEHRVNVRVINELAWHNLFIRTLLVRPEADELAELRARISRSSTCRASAPIPARHGCRSETVIAVNLEREADPDRRHRLCRRDEEVRVRHPQLPAAAAGRDADALLGQHRPEGRDRDVLRPVGHRQDHACRPMPAAR